MPKDRVHAPNLHATIMKALGIEWDKQLRSPTGQRVSRSEGTPIDAILG